MKYILSLGLVALLVSCNKATKTIETTSENKEFVYSKDRQDSLVNIFLNNGASNLPLNSIKRQMEIDKILAQDSTIAYLWQQKAMPLYKQGKYELGLKYLNQAVKYDRNNQWQEYRAFMTCIFAKTYKDAIADFKDCIRRNGNSYVMDHTYNFYIAISKIQLNEFAEAERILEAEVDKKLLEEGEEWVHHLDLFYLGISKYEQGKYKSAIEAFDRALNKYPEFAEVLYYKSNCEDRLGNSEEANKLMEEANYYGKQGHSINEDNSIYERYPYQIRWELTP